ncbi:endonuclease/exonuclease/phosphatase family protein [Streptomyces sp. NPDC005389]|uniref:endonuclease/exonuclease/phosphatase family protein n=1 Tax=Streptomyces sp. NPDC005389 TaxID=3157040 RepID=UPI0033BC8EAC
MHIPRPARALLAALALICAATMVSAPQALADTVNYASAPPIRTFTYNICGSSGTEGCNATREEDDARHKTIVDETAGGVWNADYIFLVEVCSYQFNRMDASLKPRGYTGRYVETVPAGSLHDSTGRPLCVDSSGSGTARSYGMAVFVRGSFVESTVLTLDTKTAIQQTVPGATGEDIKSPCIKSWVQNRATWACSVHLWWGAPNVPADPGAGATPAEIAAYKDRLARHEVMTREADALVRKAKEWEQAGIPVILSGDFNSSPWGDVLNRFYEPATGDGAYGTFVEADETDFDDVGPYGNCQTPGLTRCRVGELTMYDKTHQNRVQKLDYTFFSGQFFRGVVGDVPDEPKTTTGKWISDHLPLRGAAYWKDCGTYGATPGAVYRRDAAGGLYRYEGRAAGDTAALAKPCKVGFGWGVMKQVARQGTTLAAVDTAGVLWHYPLSPVDGTYSGGTRRQAGTGFLTDDVLLAPGDFDGDGTADLITRAGSKLWLHKGTGADNYAPRTQIADTGGAWADYTSVVATDFADTVDAPGTADLVAIDTAGDLWLQEGKGDGTLAERRKIGNGWQVYDALAAVGDLNGDGKPDLSGREKAGDLFYYKGDGAGGYAPRVKIGSSFPAGELLF